VQIPAHKALILYFQQSHLRAAVAVQLAAAVLALQRQAVLGVAAAHQLVHRQGRLELRDKVLLVAVVDFHRQITRLLAAAALVLLVGPLQMQVLVEVTVALARHQASQAHPHTTLEAAVVFP
jgi:hypothetical protein